MSRAEALCLSAGAALCLACCNSVYFGHYVDDVVWVLLAKSFLHGSASASWSYVPRLETSATWGFSILLLPVVALSQSALALKVWSAALWFSGAALFYGAVRDDLAPEARPAYLIGLFFSGFFLAFSGNVISEAGYLLVFGAAAWLALRKDLLRRGSPRALGALGLLSGFLMLTRLIGASFFLAACLTLLWERRLKPLAAYAVGALLLAASYGLLTRLSLGGYAGYHLWALGQGASLSGRALASNAWFYLKGLSLLSFLYFPSFLPNTPWLKAPAAALVLGVAALGARRLSRGPSGRFLLLYAAIYAAVVAAWPFQAPRFVAPLYPVFLLFFIAGATALARRNVVKVLAALAVVMVLTNAGEIARTVHASLTQAPDIPHESQLWLRDHTAPEEPIVSMDIARIRYYAGRRGVHFLASDSLDSFVAAARRLGARTFFLREESYVPTPGWQDPLKAQYARFKEYVGHRELFEPIYENRAEGVTIYALKDAGSKL